MASVTWEVIKAQFRQKPDVEHMVQITGNALKLDDYDSVKTWAGQIWVQVSKNYMPPGKPWSDEYKENFKSWMDAGCPR